MENLETENGNLAPTVARQVADVNLSIRKLWLRLNDLAAMIDRRFGIYAFVDGGYGPGPVTSFWMCWAGPSEVRAVTVWGSENLTPSSPCALTVASYPPSGGPATSATVSWPELELRVPVTQQVGLPVAVNGVLKITGDQIPGGIGIVLECKGPAGQSCTIPFHSTGT